MDLYITFLEKNGPDMLRAAGLRATTRNAQKSNVVRLKASRSVKDIKKLSYSGVKVSLSVLSTQH